MKPFERDGKNIFVNTLALENFIIDMLAVAQTEEELDWIMEQVESCINMVYEDWTNEHK